MPGAALQAFGSIRAGNIQAGASKKAAKLQFKAFEEAKELIERELKRARKDFAPFLGLGQSGANFLQGLFFGTGPSADLFFEQGPVGPDRTITEQITNPEIARLQRRINRLPETITEEIRNPREFDLIGTREVANPERLALSARLAGLSPTVSRTRTIQGKATRGARIPFGDIVRRFDPTFDFRLGEADRAVGRAFAAGGQGALSGARARALSETTSNLALGAGDTLINRLIQFTNIGQGTAGQAANAGLGAAGNIGSLGLNAFGAAGNFLQNAGAARGSGLLGAANAFANRQRDAENKAISIAGMFFCAIAREVYGIENPKWLRFQAWLLGPAPVWLFRWYAANQYKAAAWLRRHRWAKPIVRRLMDRVLRPACRSRTAARQAQDEDF